LGAKADILRYLFGQEQNGSKWPKADILMDARIAAWVTALGAEKRTLTLGPEEE